MPRALVTKTITAQNTFSDAVLIRGKFNLSIAGISGDTVFLQRSYDGGTVWKDVESYTADTEKVGDEPESDVYYRFGVKTGGYESGTILGRLSQ